MSSKPVCQRSESSRRICGWIDSVRVRKRVVCDTTYVSISSCSFIKIILMQDRIYSRISRELVLIPPVFFSSTLENFFHRLITLALLYLYSSHLRAQTPDNRTWITLDKSVARLNGDFTLVYVRLRWPRRLRYSFSCGNSVQRDNERFSSLTHRIMIFWTPRYSKSMYIVTN